MKPNELTDDARTEPAQAGSVQRVVVAHLAPIRYPVVSVKRHEHGGGIDVLLDDWVYVTVNYNYRYTNNASRAALAEAIAELLRHNAPRELPARE